MRHQFKRRLVIHRHDPDLIGLPTRERAQGNQTLAYQYDSFAGPLLFRYQVAIGTRSVATIPIGGSPLLRFDRGRYERQRNQLAVKMGHRCASRVPLIFEYKTVAELAAVAPIR